MTTRRILLAGATGLLAAPRIATAWEPARPIQLIVGFPPGGGTDLQARALADRVVFMSDGEIMETGTPAEIFANPQHERTRAFISQIDRH